VTEVEKFYRNAQIEWNRLEQHRMEFAVTMLALRTYLPRPPAKVLDVGGGPGRYAITLAKQGYTVTLVDLSDSCLQFARVKAREANVELNDYVCANATDLTPFSSENYDALMLMGPLYHLLSRGEREKAVAEAGRVLKLGGVVSASFITRYAPIRHAVKHDPNRLIERRLRYEQLLVSGVLGAHDEGHFTDAYFSHPSEIEPLMQRGGFVTLDLIACEGVTSMIDEKVNALGGEIWQRWVELNLRLGKDRTVHGGAEHLLYVGRKPCRP